MRFGHGLAVALMLASGHAGLAQDAGVAPSQAPVAGGAALAAPSVAGIAVINQERLLSGSAYGQRIGREVEAAGSALAAENRRIETQLTEEELRLTGLRRTMSPAEFRPLAAEFDTRVEGIRAAQEAKGRALQMQAEAAQLGFFETVFPILVALLESRGAAVLMDSRAVLLAGEGVDITDEAIARIDAEIGEGGPEPLIDLDGTAGTDAP